MMDRRELYQRQKPAAIQAALLEAPIATPGVLQATAPDLAAIRAFW